MCKEGFDAKNDKMYLRFKSIILKVKLNAIPSLN